MNFNQQATYGAKRERPADPLGEQVFDFGKHVGKTFAEVLAGDQGYAQWVAGLDDPKKLSGFQAYVRSQGVAGGPTKTRRVAAPVDDGRLDRIEAKLDQLIELLSPKQE